jgi:hypothetical protein
MQMFTPALSIHLATGFLIEGKAGVVRRCQLNNQKTMSWSRTNFALPFKRVANQP